MDNTQDIQEDNTEYDLDIISEQAQRLNKIDLINEGIDALLKEDFKLFSMFMSGLVGFMTGRVLKNNKFNMIIRGKEREIASLKNALIANKLLLRKIESGRATPFELDQLRQQANLNKKEFEELTGIRLPF